MKKWFSYTVVGLLVLAIGLFAYHFRAAIDAEQKLDESIQKITAESDPAMTISYSSIDVDPFNGDVIFSDIYIIRDEDIQRAGFARFDLEYSDFVNITLWGTEYGLRNIEFGALELAELSYTSRGSLVEVKFDSLNLNYRGNLWNLIVLGITRKPASIPHKINAAGSRFSLSQPASVIGRINADSLELQTHFGKRPEHPDSLASTISFTGITWIPPKPFQEKYRFLIQGFGYQTDSIPFEHASARYQYQAARDSLFIENMTLRSELFTTSVQGGVTLDKQLFSRSRLQNFVVQLHELSPRFKNFLDQLKKLTGLPFSTDGEEITLSLEGSLAEPKISF